MFKKPVKVKSNVKTKSSERKKFIEDVVQKYSIPQQIKDLLFTKADLYKWKIQSATGEHMMLYFFDNNPYFIEWETQMIPTVYFLWHCSDTLYTFTTHNSVIQKLQNGADLMLPGIHIFGELSPKAYGNLNKGAICAINTNQNRAPVAVGMAHHSSYDMFMSAGRGKAVDILHIIGDELWLLGKKTSAPQIDWICDGGPADNDQSSEDDEEGASDDDHPKSFAAALVGKGSPKSASTANNGSVDKVEEEMGACSIADKDDNSPVNNSMAYTPDELLFQCFMHALKYSVKDKLLPMPTNVFYAKHLLKYCPSNQPIEVKKTKFKKVSVFMKDMEIQGIIDIEEADGVQTLLRVDRNHDLWRTFKVCLQERVAESLDDESGEKDDVRYPGAPSIEEVWFILDKALPIVRSSGLNKGDCMTATEIRQCVTNYVKENNLQHPTDKSLIQLDPILTDAAYNRGQAVKEHLKWKELLDKISSHMTYGYRMTFPNERPICRKKDKLPVISIEFISSKGKKSKKITRIANLETFRINATEFSKAIQHGRACSCGMVTDAQNRQVVQAQGDQRDFVCQLLQQKYQLHIRHIHLVEDTKKN